MSNSRIKKFSEGSMKMILITSMVCFAVSLLFFILAIFLKIYNLSYYLLVTSVLFLTATILSKKGYPKIARIIFLLIFNLVIAFVSSYVGKGASVEFLLIFAIGLPFVFFSFNREKIEISIFCLLPFLLWLLLFFTNFKFFIDINLKNSSKTRNIVYYISIIFTLLLAAFQLIYYSYLNARVNKSEHSKKQKAIDTSNAKSQFLSKMSHEIRTPLNAVIGLSHILGDNEPRKDQKENIEALNYSGKILLNLLNNVLDFSKIQSTNIQLNNTTVDLYRAIKQIKKIHEASCLQKGIIMNLEIDANIPIVWLDIVRFNQVINNLVTNAIKFTEKGSVTLRIKKTNQTEEILGLLTEVIDTGIGIPEDKQDSIWEAFTQASSTINRLYGGTGLGLPIVKSILKAMNSHVKIDSKVDKGSHFYFQLNLKLATEQELYKTTYKKEHNFNGEKVLLVEDNDINVLVGRQILEKANLKVEVVNDGLSAVKMIKENDYDIVLMDIQMPIMDGYASTIEIRKFNTTLPILALSASIFLEVKDRLKESGMDGFIYKPFDPEDLLNKIEEAINR
ncbi:MAG: signal transduction histidine kinase/CheY-like chemotaxis protein [Polaribacter sp.]|jgi:signal transduction histidine kinase/CheY-like chemotaxis protein